MNDWYYLDDNNQLVPCDVKEYSKRYSGINFEKKRIDIDIINGVEVSTVFLGLDHNWGSGPPLVFETMIFNYKEAIGEVDCEQWHWSTYDDAKKGHQAVCNVIKRLTEEENV